MFDLVALLQVLHTTLDRRIMRQLLVIVIALLGMTGTVTMLGISRWTDKGGSYRTIQRFFNTHIDWLQVSLLFIKYILLDINDTLLIAGDETVINKAGKKTYGLGWFFSSIHSKSVQGISFLSLSIVSVKNKQSYPIIMEQVEKLPKGQVESKQDKPNKKNAKGRPKGSKNKNRKDVELPAYLQWIQKILLNVLYIMGAGLPVRYFVYDGAFGNNYAAQMVTKCGLDLISKLRHDSVLWFPYEGSKKKRGPAKKYGDRVNCKNISDEYLKSKFVENDTLIHLYQMTVWHKHFANQLNVVIIVRTDLTTGKMGHTILFSTDLQLEYDKIVEYYKLRFQIEFNFRDAKQHWGLEDFMNVNKLPVYNWANLSMFMVNVSHALMRQYHGTLSVLDIKTWFRGQNMWMRY
ncbi:transposase IS4 family protein [Candidatus Magnetobacterium bavaricum]|uniref:Transposase IS4 family protein n=1 Tax=Candidatus Magnetobacterium bavaricum TaxID=29290 RepID=A0A0F3GIS2_9BACT|nr:transposase IS4 family protein [Candidatus Magnetobacterium bavaricum]